MRKCKLIIEQDYLFSMIRLIFIFSTCSYTWRLWFIVELFYILCRRYSIIKKKLILKTCPPPKEGVLNVEFALKLRIYRSLKSLIWLKWIRKKFSTTLHTQFNYHTKPVTPFKGKRGKGRGKGKKKGGRGNEKGATIYTFSRGSQIIFLWTFLNNEECRQWTL